jgi:hypothetical protein
MAIENDPYLPFHVGQRPNVGIGFDNGGGYPVNNAVLQIGVFLVPNLPKKDEKFSQKIDEVFNALRHAPIATSGWLSPYGQDGGHYGTVALDEPLTKEQVSKLDEGSLLLCAAGKVVWMDDTGQYCSKTFRCLTLENSQNGVTPFHWRYMSTKHNSEEKCVYSAEAVPAS